MKKYEVHVKKISEGYIIVEAENQKKAEQIALLKCYKGSAIISDDIKIETASVRKLEPLGFRCK